MPRITETMKKREEEMLKALRHLSRKTDGFTKPRMIVIGGYALRAFISYSRFTRDCDFIIRKKNRWNLDELKKIKPEDYIIEEEEKLADYGFMRWIKPMQHDGAKVKVSIDLMEGEIRGRKAEERILIDEALVTTSGYASLSIADAEIKVPVPSYLDYFIMKVVSSRASDIRDIASLIHENGIPSKTTERVTQILPHPHIFKEKLAQNIIPELEKKTFLYSWRGIFSVTKYTEKEKQQVIAQIQQML